MSTSSVDRSFICASSVDRSFISTSSVDRSFISKSSVDRSFISTSSVDRSFISTSSVDRSFNMHWSVNSSHNRSRFSMDSRRHLPNNKGGRGCSVQRKCRGKRSEVSGFRHCCHDSPGWCSMDKFLPVDFSTMMYIMNTSKSSIVGDHFIIIVGMSKTLAMNNSVDWLVDYGRFSNFFNKHMIIHVMRFHLGPHFLQDFWFTEAKNLRDREHNNQKDIREHDRIKFDLPM